MSIRSAERNLLVLVLALVLGACAGPRVAGPVQGTPGSTGDPRASRPVARADGELILASDLDAHLARTGLSRREALDDLIDLTLLRAAARANGIAVETTPLSADARATAEYELARKLSLDVPPATDVLVVDHAWVKDSEQAKQQGEQRAAMERLRALVMAGATIPASYEKIGADAANWHIGDHEEYPYEVIPAHAHDLPPGSLSPLIPGDGGLHLFKIHARKRVMPPASMVHQAVRERLRDGKTVDLLDRQER